jgi:hypothetical protein
MSEPARVQQEPDFVPGVRLLRLSGLAACVAVLGVLVSWWLSQRVPATVRALPVTPRAALGAGSPEQTPIETTERGLALRARQEEQLAHYGWVDRDAGIARIPIERALDLRAEGSP